VIAWLQRHRLGRADRSAAMRTGAPAWGLRRERFGFEAVCQVYFVDGEPNPSGFPMRLRRKGNQI